MYDSERDAELIALEQEISRLQTSINKSRTKEIASDSGLPESRRVTLLDEDYIGRVQSLNQVGQPPYQKNILGLTFLLN
jgi:hypothetical protein